MGATISLILGSGSGVIPELLVEVSQVKVKSFGKERAGGSDPHPRLVEK